MEPITRFFQSNIYQMICSMKHLCVYLILIYIFAAILLMFLMLFLFFVALKIKEKNRQRRQRQMNERRRKFPIYYDINIMIDYFCIVFCLLKVSEIA
jgi:uncharacterized membrane protein